VAAAAPIKAVLFDAYGTLFDVYSVAVLAESFFPGHGERVAELWRDRQIDYTRLRTLSARYVPFQTVTEDALDYTCARLHLALSPDVRAQLLAEYTRLKCFDDVVPTLRALRAQGLPTGILTNGDPGMIARNVASADIAPLLDHVLSVDTVAKFKTAPEAYQLGPDALGLAPASILFVSSNCWDACAATWFGYTTFWVNRADLPLERLGVTPQAVGRTLTDTLNLVMATG
jgi:2-haloacid dehalogenase